LQLQSCKGMEAPYVMASCACSLDGLLTLRPFDHRKIYCQESEDIRKENQWLKFLNLVTLLKFGNESEKQQATQDLENLHLSETNVTQMVSHTTKSPLTSTDAETILQTSQNVNEELLVFIPHHQKLSINLEDDDKEEKGLQHAPSPFKTDQLSSTTTINNIFPIDPTVGIKVQPCPNLK
ncbi:hypothetical protein L208DRAFT_1290870, partial [Tricholoma matsutake]